MGVGKREINPDEGIREDLYWERWVGEGRFCKADLKEEGS